MRARPRKLIEHKAPARRAYGNAIVYRLPLHVKADTANQLLSWLDGRPRRLKREAAESELYQRIESQSAKLPLPAVAMVSNRPRINDTVCEDRLSILTVLAKSSRHVYVRDKNPCLPSIKRGLRVAVVFVPNSNGRWRKS